MRHCGDVEHRLSAYVDGELPAEEAAAVDAHLAGCAACRAVCADLEGLKLLLASIPPPALPPGLWSRVRGRLRAEPPAPPALPARPLRLAGRRVVATAALAVVALGLLIGGPEPSSTQTPPVVPLSAYVQEHLRATRGHPLVDGSALTLSAFQSLFSFEIEDNDGMP